MAPKQRNVTPNPTAAPVAVTPATPAKTPKASAVSKDKDDWAQLAQNVYDYYMKNTPQRLMLIDAFLVYLMAVGALQLVYNVLFGDYPFNAFLAGFGATVGQWVLTVSLRIQTTESNKTDFPSVSPERSFADYIFASLVLHFFVIHFIN